MDRATITWVTPREYARIRSMAFEAKMLLYTTARCHRVEFRVHPIRTPLFERETNDGARPHRGDL